MTAVVALGFSSFAADNVAPTRAELEEMYNGAYKAFDAKKFSEALKQLDAIDARQPDLAASRNLRGVILMRQGNYDQAETTFQERSFAADPIQNSSHVPDGRQREHGGFHFGQAGTFARYPGC